MKIILLGLLFLLCFDLQAGIRKSKLKVLYVGGSSDVYANINRGKVDSALLLEGAKKRTVAFEKLLKQYFKYVTAIDAKDYQPVLSEDYDVTVMDGLPQPIVPPTTQEDPFGRFYGEKREGYLPQDFDRPMLLIAELSSLIGTRLGLKTDWCCLCLDADAHHIRTEHPMFKGPFPVKMSMVMKPTPESAKSIAKSEGEVVPDSILMWRVQKEGYTTKAIRPGMISKSAGFLDSPDVEFISGGVSAKGLEEVAIGRHGNFLHWGFSASPEEMTEEAKSVFANAIVYISQFAGQTPIARKFNPFIVTGEHLKSTILRATRAAYEERVSTLKRIGKEESTYGEYLKSMFPELYFSFGTDEKAYKDYYMNNAGYFMPRPGRVSFLLDEDARSLGISNHDIRLLDEAIRLLEEGTDVAKGHRLLKRYTLCRFETPAEWRTWFETNKSRLFFTESGGWFFLVNTRDKNVPGNDYRVLCTESIKEPIEEKTLKEEETDEKEPVKVRAFTKKMSNGNRLITIRMKIHPGYRIYTQVDKSDPYLPTTITFVLPKGVEKVGELKRPSGRAYNSAGTVVVEEEAIFTQEVRGTGNVTCVIEYQSCNDQMCMPPAELSLIVK